MDVKHLKLGAELGRGNFGIVRQAMWRSTPCAVKVLFNVQYAESKELFAKELSTMRQLHHPNIVQFLGFALLPEPGIVMELFPNLSVEDYIKNVKWIRYRTARRFASEMGNAVAYLHGRHPHHFIHRDIKVGSGGGRRRRAKGPRREPDRSPPSLRTVRVREPNLR